MSQHGADHVERCAAPQHGRRGRMPKQIGALRRGGDAASVERAADDGGNSRSAERMERCIRLEEQLVAGDARPTSVQIVEHGVAGILG